MKISKIHISKYHQFEDFELDLTYPKGHEKEGQPLDKVCFIGQSGAGKTTLLEMVWAATIHSSPANISHGLSFDFEPNQKACFYFTSKTDSLKVWLIDNGLMPTLERTPDGFIVDRLLHFPPGLPNADVQQNGVNVSSVEEPGSDYEKKYPRFLSFGSNNLKELWSRFYEDVKKYQTKEVNFRIDLSKQIESGEQNANLKNKFEKWKNDNPNPLEYVAKDCLDKILNHFYLRTKTEIDDVREINVLQINSISENKTIPYEKLSSGTKQIIYTAFPIYQLLKPNSIVLMDEPENSLYPDIQKELIDYYTSFDKEKKSQFFFATHSPIIASSFEPWEIVELKFDGTGKVYRDRYYEGENHVDNYKIDPRYLRWDDILTKVFDLDVESNPLRAEMLMKYAISKRKIDQFRKEGKLETPDEETKNEIEKFDRIHQLLTGNWAVINHEKN